MTALKRFGVPLRNVTVRAADRPMWYPGAEPPSHLDGSMCGDYGFDPLGLGMNKDLLPWFREAELYNGRWAMMAVPGILFAEAVGKGPWWEAGANVDLPIPLPALIAVEVVVFAILEYKRFQIFKETGECGLLGFAPFDPLNVKTEEMKVRELKNGRLAMVAFVGFCSQAAVTGKGPLECFKAHIDDPFHANIYTSKVGPEVTVAIIGLVLWPFFTEAKKALGGPQEDEFRALPF